MKDCMNIVNETNDMNEIYDVGGEIGCYIACTGGCLITQMIAAPMAVATMDLN